MRAARPAPSPATALVTAALVITALLTACGGSSGGGGSPTAAAGGGSGTSPGGAGSDGTGSGDAGSGSGTVGCAAAPAVLVGTALGDTVTAAQETRNGDTIVVCDYKGAKVGLVKLRIQTDSSASAFAIDKKGFTTQTMTTTDEDFADEAFSNVLGSGAYQVTTLVARRGSVELLVSAKATVAQEKGLLSQLFNRL